MEPQGVFSSTTCWSTSINDEILGYFIFWISGYLSIQLAAPVGYQGITSHDRQNRRSPKQNSTKFHRCLPPKGNFRKKLLDIKQFVIWSVQPHGPISHFNLKFF